MTAASHAPHTPLDKKERFVLCSALDPVEAVLVVRNEITGGLVAQLEHIVPQTGARLLTVDSTPVESDLWVQDAIEIGAVCSRSDGSLSQRPAAIRGLRAEHDRANLDCAPLDDAVARTLQASGVDILEPAAPREQTRWIDWFGNLEVSPPVIDQMGRTFPFGRILTGVQNALGIHPDIVRFLDTQGVQTPAITVDTSWLMIGHVDEVISFVPAPDRQGFRVLLPSPRRALGILNRAIAEGHGAVPVFAGRHEETSAADLVSHVAASAENRTIQASIDLVCDQLCIQLGLEPEDIVELPALFEKGVAILPNPVNSLVCNGHVIAPRPFGPVVDGVDLFEEAVRQELEPLGCRVWFVDTWDSLHVRGGEIHCGTNTIRRLRIE